jgi:hypothetical protein
MVNMWWEIIKNNHGAINAIAGALTLVIWALYFQLLLNSYRHRIRPKININRGDGKSCASRCVISNMSAEAVYVEAIILTLGDNEDRRVCSLSDLDVSTSPDSDTRSQLFQGPLRSGEFIDIGTFDSLIEKAQTSFQERKIPGHDTPELEVMVVATYTADDGLIAAERHYELHFSNGTRLLTPTTFVTRQVRSRKEMQKVEKFMLEWYKSDARTS